MGIITGIQWDVSGIYTYNYQKSWLLGKSSTSRRIINHIMGVKGGPVNYHTIYPCGWMGWVVELLQGLNVPLFPNNHKCIHIYIYIHIIYIYINIYIYIYTYIHVHLFVDRRVFPFGGKLLFGCVG